MIIQIAPLFAGAGIGEIAHDLAEIIDPIRNGSGRPGVIDSGVDTFAQEKSTRSQNSFSVNANNLPAIINRIGFGLRGAWEIYLGKDPIA